MKRFEGGSLVVSKSSLERKFQSFPSVDINDRHNECLPLIVERCLCLTVVGNLIAYSQSPGEESFQARGQNR